MSEKLEKYLISKKCPYRVLYLLRSAYYWISDLMIYALTASLISGLWWFIWVA